MWPLVGKFFVHGKARGDGGAHCRGREAGGGGGGEHAALQLGVSAPSPHLPLLSSLPPRPGEGHQGRRARKPESTDGVFNWVPENEGSHADPGIDGSERQIHPQTAVVISG